MTEPLYNVPAWQELAWMQDTYQTERDQPECDFPNNYDL